MGFTLLHLVLLFLLVNSLRAKSGGGKLDIATKTLLHNFLAAFAARLAVVVLIIVIWELFFRRLLFLFCFLSFLGVLLGFDWFFGFFRLLFLGSGFFLIVERVGNVVVALLDVWRDDFRRAILFNDNGITDAYYCTSRLLMNVAKSNSCMEHHTRLN